MFRFVYRTGRKAHTRRRRGGTCGRFTTLMVSNSTTVDSAPVLCAVSCRVPPADPVPSPATPRPRIPVAPATPRPPIPVAPAATRPPIPVAPATPRPPIPVAPATPPPSDPGRACYPPAPGSRSRLPSGPPREPCQPILAAASPRFTGGPLKEMGVETRIRELRDGYQTTARELLCEDEDRCRLAGSGPVWHLSGTVFAARIALRRSRSLRQTSPLTQSGGRRRRPDGEPAESHGHRPQPDLPRPQ
jgi:hypothetical protein